MKLNKFLSPWNEGKQTFLPDKLIKVPSTLIRITCKKQWNFKTLDKILYPPTPIKWKRIPLLAVFEKFLLQSIFVQSRSQSRSFSNNKTLLKHHPIRDHSIQPWLKVNHKSIDKKDYFAKKNIKSPWLRLKHSMQRLKNDNKQNGSTLLFRSHLRFLPR